LQPKDSWLRPLLLFLLEGVLFLVLSTPFTRWAKSPGSMIVLVSLMALIIALGFLLLRRKLKSRNMAYYFMWALVTAAVSWLGFSLPIVLSLLFAIYFMWRTLNLLDGQTYEVRWWLFLLTVLGTIILKLVIKQPVIQRELLILLGVQSLVILTTEALEEWRLAKRITGTLTYLAGFLVIGLVGGFLRLIFPFIKWGINELLNACMAVILVLVTFLWNVMAKLLGPRMESHKDVLNNLFKNSKKQPKKVDHSQVIHHGINPELLMIIVVVVIIGIAFYIFKKWKFTEVFTSSRSETISGTFSMAKEKKKSRLFSHLKAPKDPIRAHLFYLQKKFRKREEGRLKYETVGEWLSRLTKEAPLKATIQSTYEAVRYGGDTPSHLQDNQLVNFEAAIKQVEAQILHEDQKKNER